MSTSLNHSWDPFLSTIFSEMSELALREGAVNLAQGFPDFDAPLFVKQGAWAAIEKGHSQYAPAPGLLALRGAVSARHLSKLGISYDPLHEVTVVSGATEGIFVSIQAVCSPGDEVIVFEPYYDSYPAAIHGAGATLKPVALGLHGGAISFDFDDLRAAITPNTKAIFINTPHNPTGKVFSRAELQFIADLAKERDLWVISDEVYDELYFEPASHLSIASLPEMRQRTILITSASKTFSVTGWKIGFVSAPEAASALVRAVHQFNVFCSATPLQWGVLSALEEAKGYYEAFRADYAQKRALLQGLLAGAGFRCLNPEGTYFILADYSHLSKDPDTAFAKRLTREAKVASIPISVFFQDSKAAAQKYRLLRFAFCKKEETLRAAGQRLQGFRG